MVHHITADATFKQIEIVIRPMGEAIVTTRGFGGASCQAASRLLEQALGERCSEQLTPDYHLPVETPDTLHQPH